MEAKTLILLFACLVPLFTALVGAVIEAASLQDSVTLHEKNVKRVLMFYFFVFILIGCCVAVRLVQEDVSLFLSFLTVFSFSMAPVLYFRFIDVLTTGAENNGNIRPGKYYLLFFLVIVVCCVPYTVVRFMLTVVCMAFALRRIVVCYRHNKTASPLWEKWLRLTYFLCALSVVWSGAISLTVWRQTVVWSLPVAVVAAWIQAVFLCCYSFNHHSLLFLPLSVVPAPPRIPSGERLSGRHENGRHRKYMRWTLAGVPLEVEPMPLTRKVFERRVVGEKLYLIPQLRLSDLTELFNINRSYLSRFINTTYGCGFNGYINRLRLHELERLMKLPCNKGKTANKLYPKAGFPNYQVYLRIKKEVYKQDIMSLPDTNPTNMNT